VNGIQYLNRSQRNYNTLKDDNKMRHILLLSDSIKPWHSVWIRLGQYTDDWPYHIHPCQWIIRKESGEIHGINENGQLTPPCEAILLYRWSPQSIDCEWFIKAVRDGIPLIADIDDNIWQAGKNWGRIKLRVFTKLLKEADAITCSSKNLKWMLMGMFEKKKIYLIQNSAPVKKEKINMQSGKIRIGWTGAPWTRPEDLYVLKDLTYWILKQDNTQLVHIGHDQNKPTIAEILNIPADAIETHQLMPYKQYLKHLDFDIGLAPLTRGNFSSFKSDLKLVEYSSQGIAWIASHCDPYEDLCSEWGIEGRLCQKGDEWIRHCKELISNDKYITEGRFMQEICQRKRSKSTAAKEWEYIIEKVIANKGILT